MVDLTATSGLGSPDIGSGDKAMGDQPVPRLRSDIKLLPAAPERTGQPAWTIHDPARNRYFRIGPLVFECLLRWRAGTIGAVIDAVQRETVHRPDMAALSQLVQFLTANSLVERDDPDAPASFARIAAAGRPSLWKAAVHNYLFVRVPLVRPTRFLRATQPVADFLAGAPVQVCILILGAIGLFLVSRQWDGFAATFVGFLNWQGAVALAVTLTGTKILHELGHAYTMTRHGGRVPTMGVAFLVMYPVLYTDTTDAWRLTSRKARLAVGTAGIRVELALALIATFLWSFLPDGPVRGAIFLLASATWISTLLINLSPFLRFDGYYILSDWLDIPNLQPRAFALTRWWLRETLFGFGVQPPERFPTRIRRFLVAYSLATWVYRFFLFLGIALLVYHLFFKLAGIVLFAVEIAWFILMPILSELKAWAEMRRRFRLSYNLINTVIVFGVLVWFFVTPWRTEVAAPVLVEAVSDTALITAMPARLAEVLVVDGQAVKAGDPIIRFSAPDLVASLAANGARIKGIRIEIEQARLIAEDRGDVARLERELQGLLSARKRIEARLEKLVLHSPADGVVRDLPAALIPGLWISAGTEVGRVVSPEVRAIAYADQADLPRLKEGAVARIIFEDPTRDRLLGELDAIAGLGAESLDARHLASPFGGDIAAVLDKESGAVKPLVSVYRLDITLHAPPVIGRPLRGEAFIEAPAESHAARVWRAVGSVLIRESGF